jgi:hypothetical protein
MSRCFTLDRTGLSNGIAVDVSFTSNRPSSVRFGEEYTYDLTKRLFGGGEDVLLKVWRTVSIDRDNPPSLVTCHDGSIRVSQASATEARKHVYLRAPYNSQSGSLVRIDTGHTEPCESGGYWCTQTGHPRDLLRGHAGLQTYSIRPTYRAGYADPFEPLVEYVDVRSSWDIGLVLISAGDSIEVTFNAPGRVTGLLKCGRTGALSYELTSNEIDTKYQWEAVDHQADYDAQMAEPEISGRKPFDAEEWF